MATLNRRGNSWMVSYTDDLGKRKKPLFKKRRDAHSFLNAIQQGERPWLKTSSDVTLFEAAKSFMKLEVSGRATEKQVKSLLNCFMDFSTDQDGLSGYGLKSVYYISDLTHQHLLAFQKSLQGTIKNTTINRKFDDIGSFCSFCVESGYFVENPCKKVKDLPKDGDTRYVPSKKDFYKVMGDLPDLVKKFLGVQYFCGARPSELRKLTFKDVDFSKGFFTLTSVKGDGSKKTRRIGMSDDIKKVMLERRNTSKRSLGLRESQYVFTYDGSMLGRSTVTQAVERACARQGVKPFGSYAVRHMFATEAVQNGVHQAQLMRIMGHSSSRMVDAYYYHHDDLQTKEVLNDLSRMRAL